MRNLEHLSNVWICVKLEELKEAPKGSKQVVMLLNLGRKRKLWVNYISIRFGNSGEITLWTCSSSTRNQVWKLRGEVGKRSQRQYLKEFRCII